MRCALGFLAILPGGCASTPSGCPWPRMFAEEIARVAGDEVVDCGFIDLAGAHSGARRRAAGECLAEAAQENRPFEYGTSRIPLDSAGSDA